MPCEAIENQSLRPGLFGGVAIMMCSRGREFVFDCFVDRSRPTDSTSPVLTSPAAAMRFFGVM